MSYLALARRYRPADFESIISQHHITNTLKNAVRSGRISHAYLFCGPRGTGKTTTARVMAKALNCEKGPTPEPCGECTSCKEIAVGSSPDVFEIDAASNRGIDDIRELRENVRYSPVSGRYKIYIIDEVHRLTKEAFDALLKTLEEPPSHVIFIFATTDPQALPPTILSRTQRYDFKRIPVTSLAEAVNSIAQREGISIEPNAALLMAKKADGSLRDALSLLDQLSSFSEGTISAEQTAEVLGLVKNELLSNITSALLNHNPKDALELFGGFIKSGGDSQELAEALTGYIRKLLLVKSGVSDTELLELDRADLESLGNMVSNIDTVDILRYFTILADYKSAVKQGQDPIYSLEASLVKISSLDRAVSLETLLTNMPQSPSGGQSGGSGPRTKTESKPAKTGNPSIDYNLAGYPGPPVNDMPPVNSISSTTPSAQSFEGPINFGLLNSNWPAFCNLIKENRKTVFGYLSLCSPSKFENNILTLSVDSDNKIHFEQLSKTDYRQFLEDKLKSYFGCQIKLMLIQGKATQRDMSGTSLDLDPGKFFEGTPEGKDLFDKLGGEIIGQ